jgi:hypothetical protein
LHKCNTAEASAGRRYSLPGVSRWKREWLVVTDAGKRTVPGFAFLIGLPDNVRIQLLGNLEAVKTVGPDRWKDRKVHKPLKGDADRVHQVGDKHGETLYRLWVRWQRDDKRVVVLDGRIKRNDTALPDAEYEEAQRLADLADVGADSFATADDFALLALDLANERRDH